MPTFKIVYLTRVKFIYGLVLGLNTVNYNAIIYQIFHALLVTLICLRIKK